MAGGISSWLPRSRWNYRPTEEVRSSGQILAHIANSRLSFCALAAGEDRPTTEYFEDTRTTKPEILDALEQGFTPPGG